MIVDLTVIEARDVPKMDVVGQSDPYCVIAFTNSHQILRTKVIDNDANPKWNQEFKVMLMNGDPGNIEILMKDKDNVSADDDISKVSIPLSGIPLDSVYESWFEMRRIDGEGPGGSIHLKIKVTSKAGAAAECLGAAVQ